MSKQKPKNEHSKILLEEYFQAEDQRFVGLLKKFNSPKYLASFVTKWTADQRPWARDQVVEYLHGDLNLPGHEVVFKRLYKHFLAVNDHEILGVFMATTDRMVRRNRGSSYQYNWQTRQSWSTEYIRAKPNKTVHDQTNRTGEYKNSRGKTVTYPLPDLWNKPANMLFSHRTRNYLRRSIWRYFRFLSYQDPVAYVAAIGKALAHYHDRDLQEGVNILDNWSLMHACYFHHDAICFTALHTNLVEGKSLGDLTPKPYQPDAWKTESAAEVLVRLLIDAESTLVRVWAIELFKDQHSESLKKIELGLLIELLSSPDPNLQQFASEVFEQHPALPTLTVQQWLVLLEDSNPNLLPVICDAMRKHVSEDRLENEQILTLVVARQVPVAAFGFELLQKRDQSQPFSTDQLTSLAGAQCMTQTVHSTPWALQKICGQGGYDADNVIEFFDSLLRPTRNAAMDWLCNPDAPGYNDPKLWARLIESPFDDIKITLVNLLDKREASGDSGMASSKEMTPVWVSVILGVHRGSRAKPKAISQLSQEIQSQPERADDLLPVLAVALRSIRPPEMRNALAAIVGLANDSPEMKSRIETHFPELEFVSEEVA